MARNLFSVPIFFIVFRETLEAAIIVSVLLSLVEQIVYDDPGALETPATPPTPPTPALQTDEKGSEKGASAGNAGGEDAGSNAAGVPVVEDMISKKRLIRKMRIQVCGSMSYLECTLHA